MGEFYLKFGSACDCVLEKMCENHIECMKRDSSGRDLTRNMKLGNKSS